MSAWIHPAYTFVVPRAGEAVSILDAEFRQRGWKQRASVGADVIIYEVGSSAVEFWTSGFTLFLSGRLGNKLKHGFAVVSLHPGLDDTVVVTVSLVSGSNLADELSVVVRRAVAQLPPGMLAAGVTGPFSARDDLPREHPNNPIAFLQMKKVWLAD